MTNPIIISADYYGSVIHSVQHRYQITASELARLFKCDGHKLHRYADGRELIPRDTLKRIIKYAVMMDKMVTCGIVNCE